MKIQVREVNAGLLGEQLQEAVGPAFVGIERDEGGAVVVLRDGAGREDVARAWAVIDGHDPQDMTGEQERELQIAADVAACRESVGLVPGECDFGDFEALEDEQVKALLYLLWLRVEG